ncbi:MAG TPA: PA2778 family cysteine peptidase [Pseudomonadales bacterium]
MPRVLGNALLLIFLAAASGCTLLGGPPLTERSIELTETPFFPQEAYQCGPAALATVLAHSGVPVTADELTAALYIPERHGSLQVELMAAARRHGRLAVELDGDLAMLIQQLEHGRPVLVLQNLAVSFYPVWHYAVVVGYEPARDRFVLRSGTERRELTGRGRFAATWRRADHWALVVLAPQDDPAGLPRSAYLRAAADLENTGAHGAALEAFRSAVRAWPDEPLARLGVANNLYYLGRREAAVDAYRELLERHPTHPVAVHNLVMLLVELERPCEARQLLAAAPELTGALVETARRAAASACPAGD